MTMRAIAGPGGRQRDIPYREQYALCRCGQSGNKSFCDGTHLKVNFRMLRE